MRSRKKLGRQSQTTGIVPRADVNLHLPDWMLHRNQSIASDRGVPFTDVIRTWVADKVLNRNKASIRPRS